MCCRGFVFGAAVLLLVSALGCGEDSTSVSNPKYSARSDSSFAVGDSSVLVVSNFAGKVQVQPGSPQVVHVVAEKWAGHEADLDQIDIEWAELSNGVRVETDNPAELAGVSVDLELTVPADTRPTIEIGAGEVRYTGPANGLSMFSVGAGTIRLELPSDVNVEVHLTVGAGSIDVAFPVDGQVGNYVVDGIIGTGADGRIEAGVGAGQIIVTRQ